MKFAKSPPPPPQCMHFPIPSRPKYFAPTLNFKPLMNVEQPHQMVHL